MSRSYKLTVSCCTRIVKSKPTYRALLKRISSRFSLSNYSNISPHLIQNWYQCLSYNDNKYKYVCVSALALVECTAKFNTIWFIIQHHSGIFDQGTKVIKIAPYVCRENILLLRKNQTCGRNKTTLAANISLLAKTHAPS